MDDNLSNQGTNGQFDDVCRQAKANSCVSSENDFDVLRPDVFKPEIIAMLENIPGLAWLKDDQGKYFYVNNTFLNIFNLTTDKVLGKSDFEIFPEDLARENKFSDNIVYTKKIKHVGKTTLAGRNFTTFKSPILGDGGKVLGLTGFSLDISEEYKAIQSLKIERDFLQALMDNIPYTIYFKDLDCRFTRINKAQASIIGISNPKDAIGKTDYDFFAKAHAYNTYEDERRILDTGIPLIDKTEKIKLANGVTIWILATKIAVRDEKGNITGIVGISRDVTEKMIYEERLKEAKEKAEESDRLKSAFLANMSHEIRTPMNGIVGFANLLKSNELSDEEKNDYIRYIESCSNTLLNLIDDIIDISKIEAGHLKIREAECQVNVIMKELLDSFNNSIQNEKRTNIELRFNQPNLDENFTILTDPYRFKQILTNLLSNALKFTIIGFVEMGYTLSSNIQEDKITFYVKDTGVGIPSDKFKFIFNRFEQIHDNNDFYQKGTGLGLAISKNLVKLLGGDMWVESNYGKGSVFFFTIPFKRVEKPLAEGINNRSNELTYNWSGKQILVAEDEEMNRLYLKKILTDTGAKIIWANDGFEAIKACRENDKIDLVLMDFKMPRCDGYTATREIRRIRKDLFIIAQTAYAMPEEKENSFLAGCNDYISKPIRKDTLLALVNNYFRKKDESSYKLKQE
jgi:PAS domain S-box-containing protein